ncbi:hypothetical protein BDV96DRAFT_608164 [Lophiotrema nucula]|uniref:Uncharacterized protein n=1 Tax=Lophiotrema nucula TaxID=690887 RepID=A0A6A5YEJ2_9PLEO|nr:hypothetical protein BDV96DRAFT_608164 [Lophiotrema nucula]
MAKRKRTVAVQSTPAPGPATEQPGPSQAGPSTKKKTPAKRKKPSKPRRPRKKARKSDDPLDDGDDSFTTWSSESAAADSEDDDPKVRMKKLLARPRAAQQSAKAKVEAAETRLQRMSYAQRQRTDLRLFYSEWDLFSPDYVEYIVKHAGPSNELIAEFEEGVEDEEDGVAGTFAVGEINVNTASYVDDCGEMTLVGSFGTWDFHGGRGGLPAYPSTGAAELYMWEDSGDIVIPYWGVEFLGKGCLRFEMTSEDLNKPHRGARKKWAKKDLVFYGIRRGWKEEDDGDDADEDEDEDGDDSDDQSNEEEEGEEEEEDDGYDSDEKYRSRAYGVYEFNGGLMGIYTGPT